VRCTKCGEKFFVVAPEAEQEPDLDDILGPEEPEAPRAEAAGSGKKAAPEPDFEEEMAEESLLGVDDLGMEEGGDDLSLDDDDAESFLDDLAGPDEEEAPDFEQDLDFEDEDEPVVGRQAMVGGEPDEDDEDDLEDFLSDTEDEDEPPARRGGAAQLDLDKPARKKKKKRGVFGWFLLLLLLLGLGGGGAVWYLDIDVNQYIPAKWRQYIPTEYLNMVKDLIPKSKPKEQVEDIKNITLKDLRQYYVSNENAGKIFVVEGSAVNRFEVPKRGITVRVSLFDEKGKELISKKRICGNTLSYFQLQVMSRAEIESELTAESGILATNYNVEPGEGVLFMVVFFEPPDNVAEFGVKVLEAKDLPGEGGDS
jgi:hypothetical protein